MVTDDIRRLRGILEETIAEYEDLLVRCRRALDALDEKPKTGSAPKPAAASKPKRKRHKRSKPGEMLEGVAVVLRAAEGTLTAEDVGKELDISPSHAANLLRLLVKSGDAEIAGRVQGRGNPFLWTAKDRTPAGAAAADGGRRIDGDLLDALRTADAAETEIVGAS